MKLIKIVSALSLVAALAVTANAASGPSRALTFLNESGGGVQFTVIDKGTINNPGSAYQPKQTFSPGFIYSTKRYAGHNVEISVRPTTVTHGNSDFSSVSCDQFPGGYADVQSDYIIAEYKYEPLLRKYAFTCRVKHVAL
ncbi:MAG: hypothetical protein COV52_02960 [Gammaproteobacteria bacterium CG11_big_fil_rev_8_21_14_0_20_46_22]|nr:MAG: hypothetical protein COW05_02100 [Gammaproteobacteria bacterium CG12_big_fil_rev_8_21_14_0_65_46_12]PIR11735.1 MAG: hypothetical protein COV52_02960 [Gammaproteobacteria bacterium CG11_big_fil_rev_8_21_14_0_20_46_22]